MNEEVQIHSQPTYSILAFKAAELPKPYVGFIFSYWLKSFRHGNPFIKKANPGAYYKHYHTYIENLLNKPDSTIRLAVLSDDHDVVLGFSVVREDVLDYIFVQTNHRRQGIAKKLVPPGITTISHTTQLATRIWQKKYKEIKFNPFA